MLKLLQVWNVEAGVSEGVYSVGTVAEALAMAHEDVADESRTDFSDAHAMVRELHHPPRDEQDDTECQFLTVRVLKTA